MEKLLSLTERLKRKECRNATYVGPHQLFLSKGAGSEVWGSDQRRYLDMCSGFGSLPLGHNHSTFKVALQSCQSGAICQGLGDVYSSEDKVSLLEEITDHLPSFLSTGMLCLSGSQAVEIAIKTSILATGRQRFIRLNGSYHGLEMGVLAFAERRDFKDPFAQQLRVDQITAIDPGQNLKGIEEMLKSQCFAGVIVEPIQGRAGVRGIDEDWLRGLSEICSLNRTPLIFDEVYTGFGRTGRPNFASEISCDIVCFGKALGGGMPMSACFARQELMEAWPPSEGESIHTGTFFGHPLSCRVSRATITFIRENRLCDRAKMLGDWFENEVAKKLDAHPLLNRVSVFGLMIGFEFKEASLGAQLMDKLLERGVIALASGSHGEGLTFTPSLLISKEQLVEALDALVDALGDFSI